MTIHFRVELTEPAAHKFHVTLTLPRPAAGQRLSLPVWAPGSYLVREFARQLGALRAQQGGRPVAVTALDKSTWEVHCTARGALSVSYEIHAFDVCVRTAFLDGERGFLNGPAVFLQAQGHESEPHEVQIGKLPRSWQVATAMPSGRGARGFVAADYDELLDHPFEFGSFWRGAFRVRGVAFECVVSGAWPSFDAKRLLADMQRICAAQIGFWHGRGRAPFKRYVFLLHAAEEGYGGLEHRGSAALLCARRDLPRVGQAQRSEAYEGLLALLSHEFFHAWNVLRLRPHEFLRIDYTRENYTRLLWFFEGVTSYYDELMLLRAGVIDAAGYLKLLARQIDSVHAAPGRHHHSVAQASFDAWIKFYRKDANTPNATVNYYAKGALVALAFDLTLRTTGKGSLDDVMRLLWQRCAATGVTQDDIAQALQSVAGRPLVDELQAWVHGTEELPLQALLAQAGVQWRQEPASLAARLGLQLSEGLVSGVQVRQVMHGSPAARAGLAPGDELLAVDGWRIRRLDEALQWLREDAALELLFVRGQRVRTCQVAPANDAAQHVVLALDSGGAAHGVRRAWLGA